MSKYLWLLGQPLNWESVMADILTLTCRLTEMCSWVGLCSFLNVQLIFCINWQITWNIFSPTTQSHFYDYHSASLDDSLGILHTETPFPSSIAALILHQYWQLFGSSQFHAVQCYADKTTGLNGGLNPSIKINSSLLTAICRDTNKDSKTDALTPADAEGYGLRVDIQ